MKTVTIYVAFDGEEFETAAACEAHEANHFARQFVGLTSDQVNQALSRENLALADAFEKAGNIVTKLRREAGDMKRTPAPKTTPAQMSAPVTEGHAAHAQKPAA